MNAQLQLDRPSSTPQAAGKRIEVYEYTALNELLALLRQLDSLSGANSLRVLIVLDARFSGNLAALARRNYRASRLVIATDSAALSGVDRLYEQEGVSWDEIVVQQGIEASVRQELHDMKLSDRLVMFWPNWSVEGG